MAEKEFYTPMPGKRSEGQTLIAAALDEELLVLMDSMRAGKSRSQYLREAIAEKLEAAGHTIPVEWVISPDRARPLINATQKVSGKGNKATQAIYQSPSVLPQRDVRGSKAGKSPQKKKTKAKKK